MIFCERHDDGCWASKPRHDAIPSLMKVSSRCDSTANNFSKEKETFTYMLVV